MRSEVRGEDIKERWPDVVISQKHPRKEEGSLHQWSWSPRRRISSPTPTCRVLVDDGRCLTHRVSFILTRQVTLSLSPSSQTGLSVHLSRVVNVSGSLALNSLGLTAHVEKDSVQQSRAEDSLFSRVRWSPLGNVDTITRWNSSNTGEYQHQPADKNFRLLCNFLFLLGSSRPSDVLWTWLDLDTLQQREDRAYNARREPCHVRVDI